MDEEEEDDDDGDGDDDEEDEDDDADVEEDLCLSLNMVSPAASLGTSKAFLDATASLAVASRARFVLVQSFLCRHQCACWHFLVQYMVLQRVAHIRDAPDAPHPVHVDIGGLFAKQKMEFGLNVKILGILWN
jgi:hypothetical protein